MSNFLWTNFESIVSSRKKIILRDDQISWLEAMDLAEHLSSRKKALILIDTGCFSLAELEWLVLRRAIIVSYAETGRTWSDLLLLKKVASRVRRPVIFAFQGEERESRGTEALSALHQLARGGLDLHLSGRKKTFDPEVLAHLAADCRLGHSWFVYYHYGGVDAWLIQLAKEKAWLHLDGRFLDESQLLSLEELLLSFPKGRVRLVLHLEEEASGIKLIELVQKHGGYVIFFQPVSPPLKKRRYQKNLILPFRAYHLEPRALF
ncbi:MAG: hypothetical protein N3B16_03355 [Candidatus Aminicenantes bacterium]|nr:hypothetical protein [Candidatus Aminicenantes bacterium]